MSKLSAIDSGRESWRFGSSICSRDKGEGSGSFVEMRFWQLSPFLIFWTQYSRDFGSDCWLISRLANILNAKTIRELSLLRKGSVSKKHIE